MYVIVEIAGHQFKVQKDQRLYVNRLSEEVDSQVSFDKVLLTDKDGDVEVGAPAIAGAQVVAKVLNHLKGDKVIIFKKKRRKGYQVKNGHRQLLTEILVEDITFGGKSVPAKKATKKEADDLAIVEGIGPKAAEALVKAGVDTFAKLAKKSVDEIKDILVKESKTLSHLDPQTWAEQARLASEGKWDELKKWQDELLGGVKK